MKEVLMQLEERLKSANQPNLTYPFYGKEKISLMSEALIFWKALRKMQEYEDRFKDEFYEALLLNFELTKANPLTELVILIESLPTSVWRALLWKENIDFMSYESFLRRISASQIQAIEDNINDLRAGQIPRVLKKSWRSKVKIGLGMISYKKLKEEDYDYDQRHENKGAWANNLLGLDFGFCLYPKGEADDAMITNKSITRFFSFKEHISDFVTNEEDGKYWYMYKKARSNYAFWPEKKFAIKEGICPGFWFTLIIHTLFWIVSPIALLSTGLNVWVFGLSWTSISPALFGLPMLIWLLFAFIRLIKDLFKLLKSSRKDSKLMKVLKVVAIGIFLTIMAFAGLIGIYGLFGVITPLYFKFFSPIIGPLLSSLTYLSLFFYLLYLLIFLKDVDEAGDLLDSLPRSIRFMMNLSLIAPIVIIFDTFVSEHAINILVRAASLSWQWYSSDFLTNTYLLISGLFILSQLTIFNLFAKDEEQFVKQEKLMALVIKVFLILTAGFLIAVGLREGNLNLKSFQHISLILFSLALISTGVYFWLSARVNKKNIKQISMARNFIYQALGRSNSKLFLIRRIAEGSNEKMLADMQSFISSIFGVTNEKKDFIWFLSTLPIDKWRKIIKNRQQLEVIFRNTSRWVEYKDYSISRDRFMLYIIKYLVKDGYKLERAVRELQEEIKEINDQFRLDKLKEEKTAEKQYRMWIKILHPFAWLGQRIYNFFATLKYLWDLFNKVCPYKMEKKVLR